MNNGADAADQIVNMSLKGIEVMAKISGEGAKNLATYLYAVLKDQKRTKGNNPFPADFDILIQYPDNASTFWYPYHIISSTHDYIFEPFFSIELAYFSSCNGSFKCIFGIGGGNLRSSSCLDF